jgi:hypothetical protein
MNENPPRLRERGDALAKLLQGAALEQEAVSPGARERVRRGLSTPRAARAPWLILAASLGAAALFVFWPRSAPLLLRESVGSVSGAPGSRLVTGADGAALLEREGLRVVLGPSSALRLDREPILEQGSAAFWVSAPFAMRAGAVRIEADTALYVAQVHERSVIHLLNGAARADGVPISGRWPAGAPPADALVSALAALARDPSPGLRALAQLKTPAPTEPDELWARARNEESAGRPAQAALLYAQLAQGDGVRAGNALYELARLRLHALGQPAQALQAVDEYRRRFPAGPLLQEAALTAIEARLAIGEEEGALREMDSFLARFGDSERAGEVRSLRASLRLRQETQDRPPEHR